MATSVRWSICTPDEALTAIVLKAIPGYAGHAPGVYADNHFGHTWGRANRAAAVQIGRGEPLLHDKNTHLVTNKPFRPTSRVNRSERESPAYTLGSDVPGYTGWIPGIASGNLIAISTTRAVRNNWCPVKDGPVFEKIGQTVRPADFSTIRLDS